MIEISKLYNKFNEALTWNSVLFIINKVSKTILTILLYNRLTSLDFSLWANIYSIIFIVLLWGNFGFSRSLPQYCLVFSKNGMTKLLFLKKVIIFRVFVSLIVSLSLFYFAPKILFFLKLPYESKILGLGCFLFIVEDIKSVIRLIFYSYFWQKQFNFLEAITVIIHSLIVFIGINSLNSSTKILKLVFISDIFIGMLLILITSFRFKDLLKDKNYSITQKINTNQLGKDFIVHSALMWGLITINSLTERNFLIPFLTYTLGAPLANIFKVANDGALLFQRFIVKTIGTTGTSLFAHLETKQIDITINELFIKLSKRIIVLTVILFGIIVVMMLQLWGVSSKIVQAFLLLTSLYLIQITFMASERILEVKRNYKALIISFLPYLGILGIFIFGYFRSISSDLLTLLFLIHLIRILSLSLRVYYAQKLHHVYFPTLFFITALCTSILVAFVINFMFNLFNISLGQIFLLSIIKAAN